MNCSIRIKALIIGLSAFALIVSCKKEYSRPLTPEGTSHLQFSASLEATVFNAGDSLSVFDGKGNRRFLNLSSGSISMFSGAAAEAESYLILYPYAEQASMEDGTISCTLRPDTRIAAGTLQKSKTHVSLKDVCASVSLTLPEYDKPVTGLRIDSRDGTALCGDAGISFDSGTPSLAPGNYVSNRAELSCGEGFCPGNYCFHIFECSCPLGVTLTLLLENGDFLYKEYTEKTVFSIDNPYNFGELDLSGFTLVEHTPSDPSADPKSEYANYGIDFSKLSSHPRLLMTDEDFAGLRKRVTVNPKDGDYMYEFHKAMMARAATVYRKTADLEYVIDENGNLLDVCDEAMMRLIGCAYAYKVEGDSKYLEKARYDLATVCDPTKFKDWYHTDMMCPSEMSTAVSIAYDWLFNYLTKDERQLIENALYNYELVPYSAYTPREDSNWNQSTTGAAVLTSIAIYDKYKDVCAATIDKSIASNKRAVKNIFYPYGSGKEGSGYCNYTIAFEGCLIQALETSFGTCCEIDKIQGLEENGEWFLFMDGPTGTFNFSDATDETLSARTAQVFLAAHYDRPDFLMRELEVLKRVKDYKYCTSMHANLPEVWLWKNPLSSVGGQFPTKHVWSCKDEAPLVLARIGWNYDASDSYVGLKAAGGHSSHSHLDGGSFVFDALGYRWSCDTKMGPYAGYKKDIYDIDKSSLFTYAKQKSLRWDILCQNNYFHSTLAFTWSSDPTAKLHVTDQITDKACSVVETYDPAPDGRFGGKIDITDHYSDAASSVLRTVLLSDGELEVVDEITSRSDHSAPFEWRMLTKAQAKVCDGYIELSQGDKKMYLWCVSSGDVSVQPVYGVENYIDRPSTWTPRDWDGYQSYEGYHVVKFSAEVAEGLKTGKFRTFISPEK